jgi:DnaJ-domain-containing protein 1
MGLKAKPVEVDKTRAEIRRQMAMWEIDPSEFEILWEEERDASGRINRLPGAKVRYMRNNQWQEIACYGFSSRAINLRQCLLLLERLRIAEQHGVQYQGLTFTKEVATVGAETGRKQDLLDAYDILGVSPDDPVDLIKDVYKRKSMYYHPDKGGDPERFKRLDKAYNLILESRGAK